MAAAVGPQPGVAQSAVVPAGPELRRPENHRPHHLPANLRRPRYGNVRPPAGPAERPKHLSPALRAVSRGRSPVQLGAVPLCQGEGAPRNTGRMDVVAGRRRWGAEGHHPQFVLPGKSVRVFRHRRRYFGTGLRTVLGQGHPADGGASGQGGREAGGAQGRRGLLHAHLHRRVHRQEHGGQAAGRQDALRSRGQDADLEAGKGRPAAERLGPGVRQRLVPDRRVPVPAGLVSRLVRGRRSCETQGPRLSVSERPVAAVHCRTKTHPAGPHLRRGHRPAGRRGDQAVAAAEGAGGRNEGDAAAAVVRQRAGFARLGRQHQVRQQPDRVIAQGIPDGAFDLVTGDDKKVAKYFKDINKRQRMGTTLDKWGEKAQPDYVEEFARLADMEEDSARGVVDKCRAYHRLNDTDELRRMKLEADAWTAAFFAPLTDMRSLVPTSGEVKRLRSQELQDDPMAKQVKEIADKYKFFHWYLEFPEVIAAGGFDVNLGNPPWEKVQPEEVKFFAYIAPDIANETDKEKRKDMIEELSNNNPDQYNKWVIYKQYIEFFSKFIRSSNIFGKSSMGNLNLYRIFADKSRILIGNKGKSGLVVQSGIATDELGKEFFLDLLREGQLESLYDFENKKKYFDIDERMKFSLITLTGGQQSSTYPKFSFFLRDVCELQEEGRIFSLNLDDLNLINPNTKNCPTFRNKFEAKITKKIHKNSNILSRDKAEANYFIDIWGEMFNMTRAKKFSRIHIEESEPVHSIRNNLSNNLKYVPLYESKMIHSFDHRYGTFEGLDDESRKKGNARELDLIEKSNEQLFIEPRYWIGKEDFLKRLSYRGIHTEWLLGARSIASPTNERTAIVSILPCTAIANSINLILLRDARIACNLLANINAFVCDFVARQKVGNQNLNIYILKQLPIIIQNSYNRFIDGVSLQELIIKDVMELTFTAWDIKAFADDLWREADEPLRAALKTQWDENVAETDGGHAGAEPPSWAEIAPDGFPYPPFKWDEERRARLRAELDAIYAHLYGLSREELDYILETFPIVKRKDIEKYGRYRTKEMILDYYIMYIGKIGDNLIESK